MHFRQGIRRCEQRRGGHHFVFEASNDVTRNDRKFPFVITQVDLSSCLSFLLKFVTCRSVSKTDINFNSAAFNQNRLQRFI
jgi:hypothetical protein